MNYEFGLPGRKIKVRRSRSVRATQPTKNVGYEGGLLSTGFYFIPEDKEEKQEETEKNRKDSSPPRGEDAVRKRIMEGII